MDFYRFNHCVVANRSLMDYAEGRDRCAISVVFTKEVPTGLPNIGFSILSAESILKQNILPDEAVAYQLWGDDDQPKWTKTTFVKADDYVRVYIVFEKVDSSAFIDVCFSFNTLAKTKPKRYAIPSHFGGNVYLAIADQNLFDDKGRCVFALLNEEQLIAWTSSKQYKDACQQRAEKTLALQAASQSSFENDEVPLCGCCYERPMEALCIPCGHVYTCFCCCEKFISKQMETLGGRRNVDDVNKCVNKCFTCRVPIEQFARIWFHQRTCFMCGCKNLEAVAGGSKGCGCVIGCLKEAQKLFESGGRCPACNKELHKIIQIFVQQT